MSQRKEEMLRAVSEEAQRLLLEEPPPTKPKDMKRFYKNIVHKDGCAQLTASCMFCNKSITSTGASRLVDHLLECMLCVPDVKKVCQGMRCKTIGKRQSKEVELQLLMKERDIQEQLMKSQKTEHRQQGIAAGFQSAECMLAEKAVARFFYANGLPFHVAGEGPVNNYFREMCDAIRKTPASWIPPGRKKLSGPLLDSCYEGMQSNIRARDADGTFASKFGYSYTQDGWDSIDHLPLINSAYYCNGVGAIYLRSVDTSGIRKDAEYIASLMISDIYEIGCTNVVTVVTDTCATMEKAWGYVMDEFPWVSCLPCVPHVVSLLMKDIAKIPEVAETIKEESIVVGWFSNHQKPLAILRKKVKEKFHGTCELIKAGATRFATNTLVGQRLLRLKQSLMATITDAEYVAENFKDKADEKEYTNCEVRVREHKGGTARKLVLDEESGCFWDRVDKHVKATIPIYKMLRRHDTTAPSVGKVYHGFFEIGQHISENCSELEYQEKLSEYHLERWGYGGAGHFFCAAYVLDPEFIDHKQFTNAEVASGFNLCLERIAILREVRRLHEEDPEKFTPMWVKRKTLIETDKAKQRTMEHYPTYPDNTDENVQAFCIKVKSELPIYSGKRGDFARPWILKSAENMPAHLWWEQEGSSVPHLQEMAMLVLAQPASASLCERINSEFGFIKDRRRNKLDHGRANKLVSLFHNLRNMLGLQSHCYVEPAVGWCDTDLESGVSKWGLPQYD